MWDCVGELDRQPNLTHKRLTENLLAMRYLLLVLLSSLSLSAFAQFQITALTPQSNQITDYYGDSTVAMSFSALTAPSAIGGAEIHQIIEGTNFTGFQFTVSINWGDGTTTTHSGGTEATAFNPNAIQALNTLGFIITSKDSSDNPLYHVDFGGLKSSVCFSKVYRSNRQRFPTFQTPRVIHLRLLAHHLERGA